LPVDLSLPPPITRPVVLPSTSSHVPSLSYGSFANVSVSSLLMLLADLLWTPQWFGGAPADAENANVSPTPRLERLFPAREVRIPPTRNANSVTNALVNPGRGHPPLLRGMAPERGF
jgi:hypothetical protein